MNDIVINKEAKLLLKNLFYNRLVQLEAKVEETPGFQRQLDVRKVQEKVELFIERNPYGIFEIRVLNKDAENMEDYKYALVIKNFVQDEVRKPTSFYITIDATFSSADFYQLSLNGVMIPV